MTLPNVTLIVTQRDRFSLTKPSLDSILADYAAYPFQLIYVDGNSPPDVSRYLQQKANKHQFIKLIRQERYLRSNEARNLALPLTESADYIVFIDNDVIVESGWLRKLVKCAQEERATIVSPLILEGKSHSPERKIYTAGIQTKRHRKNFGQTWLEKKPLMQGAKLSEVEQKLKRSAVDAVESHCMLVCRSLMSAVILDEVFDNLEDYIDVCLQATELGGKIFVEPSSRVTYLNPNLITCFDQDDLQLYFFKWNENSVRDLVAHATFKWNLSESDPYIWRMWKRAIGYRQVAAKSVTSESSLYRMLLQICKTRLCPSELRVLLENLVLKRAFPESGNASKFKQVMKAPARQVTVP